MRPSLNKHLIPYLVVAVSFFSNGGMADTNSPIKISVLKFGTVNWTLETIKKNRLDKKNGFELIIQPLASTQAG
ncbi:MAG: ABC transporter substrate-binding protein, partial [Cycloclasticus sp.]|nr:ABC transporter substrate-binding protein [Cycloclasticus sp.]